MSKAEKEQTYQHCGGKSKWQKIASELKGSTSKLEQVKEFNKIASAENDRDNGVQRENVSFLWTFPLMIFVDFSADVFCFKLANTCFEIEVEFEMKKKQFFNLK